MMKNPSLWLVLLLLYSLVSGDADPSAPVVRSQAKASPATTASTTATSAPSNVLQIIEKEVYDGKDWRGAYPSRWTNPSTGKSTDPPPSLQPPKGYAFEGSWKIVTSTTSRDNLGWEYSWIKDQPAQRSRIWLRTIVPVATKRQLARKQRQQQQQQRQQLSSILKALKDDFNFKGFGLTLYKSFLFWKSCGVAFRMPLLSNFDWWDRHPELPSLTSSVAVYFPWMVVGWLSTSVNTDWLQWMTWRVLQYAHVFLRALLLYTLQLICLPGVLVLYPVRSNLQRWPTHPKIPPLPNSPPVYSLVLSQRIGLNISYRYSWEKQAYEFRCSHWYCCLPTIAYLVQELLQQPEQQEWLQWLRRKTGSLGFSLGRPTPDPPHFSFSGLLSLSGFHFSTGKRAETTLQQQQQRALGGSTSSSSTSLSQEGDESKEEEEEEEEEEEARKRKVSR